MVEVFSPGSRVNLNGVDATVLAVQIRGKQCNVTYELVWWNGNSRTEQWVDGLEVTGPQESIGTIGFKPDE